MVTIILYSNVAMKVDTVVIVKGTAMNAYEKLLPECYSKLMHWFI